MDDRKTFIWISDDEDDAAAPKAQAASSQNPQDAGGAELRYNLVRQEDGTFRPQVDLEAEAPAGSASHSEDAAGIAIDMLTVARQHLRRHVEENSPDDFKIVRIDTNPHSLPGKPLYESFVANYKSLRFNQNPIRLLYHGTAEQNIDSILEEGLDPALRSGQAFGPGEYFASQAQVSIPYAKGANKLLLFAAITTPMSTTENEHMKALNVVVVNKQGSGCWYLPLAVVHHEPGRVDAILAKGKKALATIAAKKPSRKRKAKAKAKDASD